jgi:hypothetical protein
MLGLKMMTGVVWDSDLGFQILVHSQPILRARLPVVGTMAHKHLRAKINRFGSLRVLLIENLDRDGWVGEIVLNAVDPTVRPGIETRPAGFGQLGRVGALCGDAWCGPGLAGGGGTPGAREQTATGC